MPEIKQLKTVALGLVGAAIGGCVGYYAFFWIVRQRFYALLLPPALLGYVAGMFARKRSMVLAAICGVLGLALGLYTEWKFAPFAADNSLWFFLTHLNDNGGITKLMLVVGPILSFSLALVREEKPVGGSETA